MYAWNTTEGGPCFLRPTPATASDAPNPELLSFNNCVKEIDSDGKCVINNSDRRCMDAYCDENLVVHEADLEGASRSVSGPWTGVSPPDISTRHSQGWSNQFSFPYEVGLYWDFTVGGPSQRAMGCPGLDEPFGTTDNPLWPFRTKCCPIYASPAMNCHVNTYAPEGRPMHEIVDDLASDNEYWWERFLEGWQGMTANGYNMEDLVDGPQNGWLGYYSLDQQGVVMADFETYIAENSPVTFTDPTVRTFHLKLINIYSRLTPTSVDTRATS